ncbi:hypothetical protein Tco_0717379 [Tanacetum coccineum]
MMMASKSYEKHPAHKKHDDQDEDPTTRSDRAKDKKRPIKDTQPSKISSASKESSKGNTLPKTSKFGKFVTAEEPDEEHVHNMSLDDEENIVNEIEQTWFNDLESAQKDPITFDELMATPIDFSKFAKNRLKLENITKVDLVGPVYNLLKGTCQSDRCPFDLTKPLPLKGHPGHLTVAVEYFFNNDLEYLKSKDSERKYTTSITKEKAARYELVGIENIIPKQWSATKVGYDKDIELRRAGRQKYKFKEGNFVILHLNDIEDMLLLVVQHKLFHLNGDVIVDLAVALQKDTRSSNEFLADLNVKFHDRALLANKKRINDVNINNEVEPSTTLISSSAEINHDTPTPQGKWSRDKHILLVNILGKPQAAVTTRSRVRDFEATSAYECIYVNFQLKIEPKRVIEALKEEGWVIGMQERLNQFE